MAYEYGDEVRHDILRMVPPDGHEIGSIGCGTAATEAVLVRRGIHVHGVDIAPEAIELARPRLTSARVITPDNLSPFEPGSLDGLILADVIEHIPLAWRALAHFAQCVRPGGWIIISVPNMRNMQVMSKFIFHGDWPEDRLGIFDATHVQIMTKRRLTRWCGMANLKIERWFDKYESPRDPWADWMTLKIFHTWFTYQLQVLCRRPE
jgi:2-polyprenyl-3-methyl-5-hydroxy-6-metoxy-1,4-benzoquinol methylase